MARLMALSYGTVCYLIFFVTFLYLIGFVGNLFVPKSVDLGGESLGGSALLINLGLIALFGLQHSIMARQGFKRWWTQYVPRPIERSTYVLLTSVILIVMFMQWRPMTDVIWSVDGMGGTVLWAGFGFGWLLVLASTFMVNHFELFGLSQVFQNFRQKVHVPPAFQVQWLYRIIRHPLYLGMIIGFWSIPHMTEGHLILAAGFTVYTLIGIRYEERDMAEFHGVAYEEYRAKVTMLVPGLGKVVPGQKAAAPTAEDQPAE